jgi:hypothetical protein
LCRCYGGLSGSNYACTLADGRRVLLKCANDQNAVDIIAQVAPTLMGCARLRRLSTVDARLCRPRLQVAGLLFFKLASAGGGGGVRTCLPWPLAGREGSGDAADYVSVSERKSPAIVLDFLPGRPADKVCDEPGVLSHPPSYTFIIYTLLMS